MWMIQKHGKDICYGCGKFETEVEAKAYIREYLGMKEYFNWEAVKI